MCSNVDDGGHGHGNDDGVDGDEDATWKNDGEHGEDEAADDVDEDGDV